MNITISDKSTDQHLNWYEAVEYCQSLGDGWRLPTVDELRLIYVSDHDFEKKYYWASNEDDHGYAWAISMECGTLMYDNKRLSTFHTRAVKDLSYIYNMVSSAISQVNSLSTEELKKAFESYGINCKPKGA